MKVLEVIECKRWRNTLTGQTASIYGSCPWYTETEKPLWKLETTGYTWKNSNGTTGLGRVPAKTYEEAVAVMNKVNNL